MLSDELKHKLGVLAGALMIGAGIFFAVRMISRMPAFGGSAVAGAEREQAEVETRYASPTPGSTGLSGTPASAAPTATPARSITAGAVAPLPAPLAQALRESGVKVVNVPSVEDSAGVDVVFTYGTDSEHEGTAVFREIFAVVDRFDTPTASIPQSQLQDAWIGESRRYRSLAILNETVPALETLFGPVQRSTPITFDTVEAVKEALYSGAADLAILPFDQLVPELTVYDVDSANPIAAEAPFDIDDYTLVATLYANTFAEAEVEQELDDLFAGLPDTNRDKDKMTTVAMTGVTAMVRFTAARMDQRGYAWPAEDVGPTLSAVDITAVSNEVPFVDGCETDLDPDNIIFCSKPEYLEALLAAGADIVGLTGNHLNDHGPEAGLASLQYYEDAGLQVYGGGADKASAMQPIVLEHNGNRIAFLGANSYGPQEAWATDFLPGSAPFDLNIMSAMIRSLKEDGDADVVMAELQYQESYDVKPLPEQQADFRALVRAGADVVTGVQSHVAQEIEFLDGSLILYGLGNFYFDQMWQDTTREAIIPIHTIYDGRHIATRLLPTILYDYGQPRFASPVDGARILERVYAGISGEQ